MDAVAILLLIFLLIGLGVGGYFGYTKWWSPSQCNKKPATANVATWVWNSNVCQANTCMTGFTLKADKSDCVKSGQSYQSYSNVCAQAGTVYSGSIANGVSDCQAACDTSECAGFDWTNNVKPVCSLIPSGTTVTLGASSTTDTCYIAKK
jgi:hypothetical protein